MCEGRFLSSAVKGNSKVYSWRFLWHCFLWSSWSPAQSQTSGYRTRSGYAIGVKKRSWTMVAAKTFLLLLMCIVVTNGEVHEERSSTTHIGIAGSRREYAPMEELSIRRRHGGGASSVSSDSYDDFSFGRFHSPDQLAGDWVLAESEQTARGCTCEDVLRAYLSGDLQVRWNRDKVKDCHFTRLQRPTGTGTKKGEDDEEEEPREYYQQDLVLHSQRVIRSSTGEMRYSQQIDIDKISDEKSDSKSNYSVSVTLIDPRYEDQQQQSTTPTTTLPIITTTEKKPFEKLSVYVGLQQQDNDVRIYAAGLFKVNRKVVPNLVVFDASSIAASQAGKGTLWLAAHFEDQKKQNSALPSTTTTSTTAIIPSTSTIPSISSSLVSASATLSLTATAKKAKGWIWRF
jgi:hypothetical protein